MRFKIFLLSIISFLFQTCEKQQQKEGDWIMLFNEKDLNDWIVKIHHYDLGENFDSTFRVRDGMIQVRYDHYGDFNDRFGHLFYKAPFSKFHLKLEYRFTGTQQAGAPEWTNLNSGVMF